MTIKKLIFLLFLNFFFSFYVCAQDLIKEPIIKCVYYISTNNYQKAIEAGKQAINLYPKDGDAYVCLGMAYYAIGQLNLALENLKIAEMYVTDKEVLMTIYGNLGDVYWRKGDLDNALLYSNKSLDLTKKLRNKEAQAVVLQNIAAILGSKGKLDEALNYCKEALKLTTDNLIKAQVYNNIAIIYAEKKEYNKAIDYFNTAIKLYKKYNGYHYISRTMLNLGNTYRKMKDFDNAYFYLSKGLEGVQKIGDKYSEALAYAYLGWYFKDKGDKELAKDYFNKAYELFESIGAEAYAQEILSISKEESFMTSKIIRYIFLIFLAFLICKIFFKRTKESREEIEKSKINLKESQEIFHKNKKPLKMEQVSLKEKSKMGWVLEESGNWFVLNLVGTKIENFNKWVPLKGWVAFAEDEMENHWYINFYELKKNQAENRFKKIWVAIIYSQKTKKQLENCRNLCLTMALYEADCMEGNMKLLELVDCDEKGEYSESIDNPFFSPLPSKFTELSEYLKTASSLSDFTKKLYENFETLLVKKFFLITCNSPDIEIEELTLEGIDYKTFKEEKEKYLVKN